MTAAGGVVSLTRCWWISGPGWPLLEILAGFFEVVLDLSLDIWLVREYAAVVEGVEDGLLLGWDVGREGVGGAVDGDGC